MDTANLAIILSAQDKASAILGAITDKLKGMGLAGGDSATQLDKVGDSAAASAEKLKLVGAIAAGAVAAGVAAIGYESVKAAANFQQATTTLVTTAGESKNAIAGVRTGMLELSTQTGTSATALSTAMYTIESAGFHGANGLEILKAAAQGAKAENADLGKVADAVTSAMIDYHEPASQAANVTSKLVAAVGQGKSNFEDFSGALHSVLPIASAAHISMNDILGDLASMTVHGISADQATQNMAEAIRSLQSPSQGTQQYLAQLGITASDLSDKLSQKGLSGTLQEISTAIMQKMGPSGKVLVDAFNQSKSAAQDAQTMISKMPAALQTVAQNFASGKMSIQDYRTEIKSLPTDQANLLQQFASLQNRASGFNNMLKSGSPAALSYSQALQKATGNATTMNVALMLTGENANYTNKAVEAVGKAHAEAGNNVAGWAYIQKNFNQQLSEAQNALKNTGIALGSALLPPLTKVLDVVVKIVTPIADWIEHHQKLAAVILGSLGAFAALTATILTMSFAFGKIKSAFSVFNVFSKGSEDVSKMGGALDEVSKGTSKIGEAATGAGKGIGDFIKGILSPLGSTEVLKGAASAALVGAAIVLVAYGVNEASKSKINIANLAIMTAATVIIGGIFAILSTFAEYAIIGAIAAAVIGGGLYLAAKGISGASDASKDISESNLLKLSAGLATVSVILAAIMPWAAFAAIGSLIDMVVAKGLQVAAIDLFEASRYAQQIKPAAFDDLLAIIKKLSTLNAGGLMSDLLNMAKTTALSQSATEIYNTAMELNKVPEVKAATITNIKDVLEKMGTLNAGNLFKDWGTASASGDLAATAKNMVTISTDLNDVKPVDGSKMDKISAMITAAGKINTGSFIAAWGKKQSSGDLADTAKNMVTISTDLGNVKIVDPTKIDKIQQMIEKAGSIKFGGFWSNWGTSNASGKLKDSINNIVQISDDVSKIKTVSQAQINNLDNIQAFITKAGGLKFSVTQVSGADLAAMTNQGVALAQKFVDGVNSLFGLAQNAGHKLQSTVWQAIQSHMSDENSQGKAMAQQFINGLGANDGAATNAGHAIQSAFWNGIQSHFNDEYQQGKSLGEQVINGINSESGSWNSAGKNAVQGFANGITANIGIATRAAASMGTAAANQIRTALGIHSPSTVFAEIGDFTMQGLQQGIVNGKDKVVTATQDVATSTVTSAKSAITSAQQAQGAVTVAPKQTTAAAANTGNVEINLTVKVGMYAGTAAETNTIASTIWQAMNRIANSHNLTFPQIGVLPN